MTPVTDPSILSALEGKPITDPALLAQLEGKNSTWDVVKNAAVEGVAGVPDMFLNAPNRLANLAKIPVGVGMAMVGKPDLAPQMTEDPDLARRGAIAAGAIDPKVVPRGMTQKIVDALVRGGAGGLLTGGASVPKALAGAALGGLSSAAATGTKEATGSDVAGVLAGLAIPAGAAGFSKAAESTAGKLMQSALKPSVKDLKSGDADKAIRTMLDEGISVSKGGVAKLKDRVSSVNDEIAQAVANSNATVNKGVVAGRLYEPLERANKQVNPAADIATVERVWNEFGDHPMLRGQQIPVQLAQELKQGTYRQLSKKYGEVGSIETEAQKALARGLKEEIATAVPEVGPLNARESSLLNALKMAEQRALLEGNKNPVGLGPIASTPAGFATFLADRSALVKSLLARGLNSSGNLAGDVAPRALAPLSFQEDAMRRQQIIEALMGRQ